MANTTSSIGTAHPISDASSDAWNFAKDTVESSMTLRAVWYQYADMHEKVSLRGKPYAGALVEYRDRAGSVVYTLKASRHRRELHRLRL